VVFGLLGFTAIPPAGLPASPGTWLSDVPGGTGPGGYSDDEPGASGLACGSGVAGARPVAGGMGVAGEMSELFGFDVFGVGLRRAPVVRPGDDSADAGGCAGWAFSAGAVPGDVGEGFAGVACGAGDVGTGVTVPEDDVCAAPGLAAITVTAAIANRHRIVRIEAT
jgi:hypothetical protein